MDQERIRQLIELFAYSGLTELEYGEQGSVLRLFAGEWGVAAQDLQGHRSIARQEGYLDEPSNVQIAASQDRSVVSAAEELIVAPIAGIAHLQPGPEERAFASVGERVGAGQTVCLIEAMKVFSEVRAEHAGTVTAVSIASGSEVSVGQALISIRKD